MFDVHVNNSHFLARFNITHINNYLEFGGVKNIVPYSSELSFTKYRGMFIFQKETTKTPLTAAEKQITNSKPETQK